MPLNINITDIDNLTERERDVLALVAGVHSGNTLPRVAEIAEALKDTPLPIISDNKASAMDAVGELADLEEGQAADLQEANERANASTPAQAAQVFSEATAAGAQVPPVDKTGLPWDERIHSSSRALNSDGTWRVRRGADKDQVALIEAQLRSSIAFPALASIPAVPVPPVTTGVVEAAPITAQQPSGFDRLAELGASPVPVVTGDIPANPLPQIPAVPLPPVVNTAIPASALPPVVPNTPANDPTADVMRRCSDAVIGRKVTPDQITAVCQSVGLERIAGIVTNRAKAPELSAALLAQLGI